MLVRYTLWKENTVGWTNIRLNVTKEKPKSGLIVSCIEAHS